MPLVKDMVELSYKFWLMTMFYFMLLHSGFVVHIFKFATPDCRKSVGEKLPDISKKNS